MDNQPDPVPADLFDEMELDIDYNEPAQMPPGEVEALERASWHMGMAERYQRDLDQIDALYKAEMERLQIRREHRKQILQAQIDWHLQPVESLHRALLADDDRRKTIELPHGTSKMTVRKQPKVFIEDKAALLAWAEQNHDELLSHDINVTAIRTIAKPDRDLEPGQQGLAVDEATGEIIPGVRSELPAPDWKPKFDNLDES